MLIIIDKVVMNHKSMTKSLDPVTHTLHAAPAAKPLVRRKSIGVIEVVPSPAPTVNMRNCGFDACALGDSLVSLEPLVERHARNTSRSVEIGEVRHHPDAHHD